MLICGHGDVVRGMADQWQDGLSPWHLTEVGDRWYGRGTADNKGYVGKRRQFGGPIARFQAIQHMLADAGADLRIFRIFTGTDKAISIPLLAERIPATRPRRRAYQETTMNRRQWLAGACAAAGTAALGSTFGRVALAAAPYPSRPIRLVVPFVAGTAPDSIARTNNDLRRAVAAETGDCVDDMRVALDSMIPLRYQAVRHRYLFAPHSPLTFALSHATKDS